jgi:glycosyltransferase involved in cell wall biosynthesis
MHSKSTDKISLVIPVHNESANLEWHNEKITTELQRLDINYEIIYIDDGSTDNSLEIVKKIHNQHNFIHFISFSKNFGKEAAITAGLRQAKGDAVLIIDADGQHPIELLKDFITKWQEGFEVVIGVRQSNQGEGVIKSVGSKLFYSLLKLVDNNREITPGSTDFRLIDRKVVDQYNLLTERNRISRNLVDWLGYKRVAIPFHAQARHAGNATYSYSKLIKLAIDGAITHSTRPLKLIGVLGMFISTISFLLIVFIIIENYILSDPLKLAITGTASLAVFLSFLVGIVLTCQGLLALYLENVYHETQNRPLYIIREEK